MIVILPHNQNKIKNVNENLKTSNHDLSFKGLSLYKPIDKIYNKKEFLTRLNGYFQSNVYEIILDKGLSL